MIPVEFILYKDISESISVDVVIKDETLWLTQKSMAELFGVDLSTIARHLKNIFSEGELTEELVRRTGYCKNCNNHSAWSNSRKRADKAGKFL